MTESELCREVDENMSDVIEGVASDALFDHIAGCERCRDARHEAEQLIARLAALGAEHRPPAGLAARVLSLIDSDPASARDVARPEHTASRAADGAAQQQRTASAGDQSAIERALAAPAAIASANASEQALVKRDALTEPPRSRPQQKGELRPRSLWVWLSAAAALLLGILWLSSRPDAPLGDGGLVHGAWHGEVLQVQRAFGSPSGLVRCGEGGACQPVSVGDEISLGARVETDGLTRALIKFTDGTTVALDRGSRLELDGSERRRGRLVQGNLVAEVAELGDKTKPGGALTALGRAVIDTPAGRAEVLGTKFALRADRESARVEVSRGVVRLVDAEERAAVVQAGEAGQIAMSGRAPRVESVLDLGQAFGWPSRAFETSPQEREGHGALGELTAKRPRDQEELAGAVQLSEHHVKVRIVDNIARTEVEEIFTNQTDEVLEGIYRFPLPPGAQIERLALDVDGKLIDGAFVDRERGQAIWRGAIVNSGGKRPPPVEEIIWVPGPWKDPALLEWQRGNRFELRIFPIPRRSSRRIVLAYTELLAPTEGGRQYTYPLPQDPSGGARMERFTLNAEVRGHDPKLGVEARGYPLKTLGGSDGVARLAFEAERFSPVGDLALGFQLENPSAPVRVWAYEPHGLAPQPPSRRSGPSASTTRFGAVGTSAADEVPDSAPYLAIALRPDLPRRAERQARDYVLITDTSRSMIGESYRRAVAVIERTIAEMDRNDRVTVLACDSVCQSLPGGYRTPGGETAEAARRFLGSIEPEGASDLAFAIEQAARLAERGGGRALRVVYVGDGTPTVGPIHPALLARAVGDVMPRGATLSAVAIGSDADRSSLEVATEAGAGVTLTFAPGQSAEDVAYAVLGATYGHTLKNARLELPDGLVAVAPQHLGSIAAGAEEIVVARLTRPNVSGQAVLRGELAGEPFVVSYPISVIPTTSEGNAFVPRLYAAVAIAELDRSIDESARRRSIELSTRFNVASRHTSLLVLESAAMFEAFGLDPERRAPIWSGDQASNKNETWGETSADEAPSDAEQRYTDKGTDLGLEGYGTGGGGLGRAAPAPAPAPAKASSAPGGPAREKKRASATSDFDFSVDAPTSAAPAASSPREAEEERSARGSRGDFDWGIQERDEKDDSWAAPKPQLPQIVRPEPPPFNRRRMIPMRRVWDRVGRVDVPPRFLDAWSPSRRATLESRVHARELSRNALKDLYVVDFLAGDLERAADSAERWSEKDPLDPDALTARADLAAQRGNREHAIRILGSVVDVRPGDYKAQWRLARLHRWAGAPERGCRHSLAVAQLMLRDAKLVAEALRCARDVGRSSWAEDLLAAVTAPVRAEVERHGVARPSDELSGDLRVTATWQGAEHDLDLVILHPEGYRVSWLGAPTRSVISATDVLSVRREGLALRGADAGQYAIEVVRSSPAYERIYGELEILAGKETRRVPFTLEGDRLRVATAEIKLQSRLVPVETWMME